MAGWPATCGSSPGWNAPEGVIPSVEEIRDRIDDISSTANFRIPANAAEA